MYYKLMTKDELNVLMEKKHTDNTNFRCDVAPCVARLNTQDYSLGVW